jgi:hypothetical protein
MSASSDSRRQTIEHSRLFRTEDYRQELQTALKGGSLMRFFQSHEILGKEVQNLWILNLQCLTGAGVDEPCVLLW